MTHQKAGGGTFGTADWEVLASSEEQFSVTLSSMQGLCRAKQFSLLEQFQEMEGGELPSVTCLKAGHMGSATHERGAHLKPFE